MEWWNVVLPVATLVLGAVLNEVASERRERRAWQRDAAQQAEERSAARLEKRDEFQLEVLCRCHAALGDLARASGRAHHFDTLASRETGRYASRQLPEEVSDQLQDATRGLYDLIGLVLDDGLRSQLNAAHAEMLLPSQQFDSDPRTAEALFASAALTIHAAQEAVSSEIRALYARE